MTKTRSVFVGIVLGLCFHSAAHAQLARTYVSSFGNDANDCNRATPCRTFQRAHNQTLAKGEITVLDPGGYGAVTITKTISIINDGVGEAGVLVSGGLVGISVNAGPTDRVSLRGLTVKGIGFGGANAIRFVTGASLTIENCVVRNHDGDGIQMLGNLGNLDTIISITITNTLVADNGGNGIFIRPVGGGILSVMLNRVETYNNSAHGIGLSGANLTGSGKLMVTVVDSVAFNNGLSGFSTASGNINATVDRSAFSHNGIGISAVDTSVSVYGSVLSGNGTGISTSGLFDVSLIGGSFVVGNNKGVQGNVASWGDNYWYNFDTGSSPLLFQFPVPLAKH